MTTSRAPALLAGLALVLAACGGAATAAIPDVDETPTAVDEVPDETDDDIADIPDDATATDDDVSEVEEPGDTADADDTEAPGAEPADTPAGAAVGFEVRIDGATISVVRDDGVAHDLRVGAGESLRSYLARPGSTGDHLDVVAVALRGERPVLYGVTVRGADAVLTIFPDALQPLHEVDAGAPAVAWTPDGGSVVWTEPVGAGIVLRTVGWDDGPGTGRPADDNATFQLEGAADLHVDGFEVDGDQWLLLLRPGAGGDPVELPIERQADGALALPR